MQAPDQNNQSAKGSEVMTGRRRSHPVPCSVGPQTDRGRRSGALLPSPSHLSRSPRRAVTSRAHRCRVRSASSGPWRHWAACWAAWVASASHASAAARFAVAASVAAATTWAARASYALAVRASSAFTTRARMRPSALLALALSVAALVTSLGSEL